MSPAELREAVPERRNVGFCFRIGSAECYEHADAAHPPALLRAHRTGPGRSAPPTSAMNSRRLDDLIQARPTTIAVLAHTSQANGALQTGARRLDWNGVSTSETCQRLTPWVANAGRPAARYPASSRASAPAANQDGCRPPDERVIWSANPSADLSRSEERWSEQGGALLVPIDFKAHRSHGLHGDWPETGPSQMPPAASNPSNIGLRAPRTGPSHHRPPLDSSWNFDGWQRS